MLCLNGQALPRIWAGCFGSIDLRIEFIGKAAHSGVQGNGVNAIEQSLPVLSQLQTLKAKIESRTSTLPPPPGHKGEPLHAKLTITMASGGTRGSSLPGNFEVIVNRRYLPEEDYDTVVEEILATVGDAVGRTGLLDWNWAIQGHLMPVVSPAGDTLWPRWIDALSRGFKWRPEQFKPSTPE